MRCMHNNIPNRVWPEDIPETLDSLDLCASRIAFAYRMKPESRRIVIVLGDATELRVYDLDR